MVNCPGRRPGVVDAIQPSLYMARLPNTSTYWDVWRVGALLSLSVYSRLVPSSGSCSTPSTSFGGVMPGASESVGATSVTGSEERSVGKEGVSRVRIRCLADL